MQVLGLGPEFPYRWITHPGIDRYEMAFVAYIHARYIRMHDLQSRIFPQQPRLHLPAIASAYSLSTLQSFKSRHLPLCHGTLNLVQLDWPDGSVGENTQTLRRGQVWPFSAPTRHHSLHRSNRS